ncbi:MAG: VOC family protein [Chthonomonadales bacterium]|nr:VOC family protein [Chthonomonadales bacterium]
MRPEDGKLVWQDLTVPDADRIRSFYEAVVGWTHRPEDMGGYEDYHMIAPDGSPVTGICHARGVNADLPPQWLLYFQVADMDAALEACKSSGGDVIAGPRMMGDARFAVIRDPAGAVCALWQPE